MGCDIKNEIDFACYDFKTCLKLKTICAVNAKYG